MTRSRSRKIFEGSEPEPPKLERLRNNVCKVPTLIHNDIIQK